MNYIAFYVQYSYEKSRNRISNFVRHKPLLLEKLQTPIEGEIQK